MGAHKKPEVRKTYGYKALENIQKKAKIKAEKEKKTLSSKVEELLLEYIS